MHAFGMWPKCVHQKWSLSRFFTDSDGIQRVSYHIFA